MLFTFHRTRDTLLATTTLAAEQPDICCDGAPWDDSPEGLRKWLEWCDSPEPVFTDKEYAQLQTTLRAMREEQAPLLKQRAQTTDALFE